MRMTCESCRKRPAFDVLTEFGDGALCNSCFDREEEQDAKCYDDFKQMQIAMKRETR